MARPSATLRLLALGTVLVLALTLTTPARAEADVATALLIASAAAAGLIIVAYLVIANVSEYRSAAEPGLVRLACADPACPVAPHAVTAARAPEFPNESP